MSVVINSNVASLVAQRSLNNNTSNLQKVLQRLSTGSRINGAKDDAAGLSISEKMTVQLNGYSKAINNTKDGMNALDIADSGLQSMIESLQRIRELTVQAANGTYSSTEKTYMLDEIKARLTDMNRVIDTAKYNDTALLDGTLPNLRIQTGPDSTLTTNTIDIGAAFTGQSLTVTGLGLDSALTATGTTWSDTNVRTYMDSIDSAVDKLLRARSKVGSMQNRMDAVLSNLNSMQQNLTSSQSAIRDTDIAKDTAEMTRLQILQQSTTQVLQQVNQLPALALKLLGGQ
jgi:flagellin